jgi:hypothetical protein
MKAPQQAPSTRRNEEGACWGAGAVLHAFLEEVRRQLDEQLDAVGLETHGRQQQRHIDVADERHEDHGCHRLQTFDVKGVFGQVGLLFAHAPTNRCDDHGRVIDQTLFACLGVVAQHFDAHLVQDQQRLVVLVADLQQVREGRALFFSQGLVRA